MSTERIRLSRRALLGAAMAVVAGRAGAGEEMVLIRHDAPRILPAITLRQRDGTETSLDALRGKVTVFHLWASWCASCRTEFPALLAFQEHFARRGVALVTVGLDRLGWPTINRTLDQLGAQALPVYLDRDRNLIAAIGARGLPTSLILDGQGREVVRVVGALDWMAPAITTLVDRLLHEGTASSGAPAR